MILKHIQIDLNSLKAIDVENPIVSFLGIGTESQIPLRTPYERFLTIYAMVKNRSYGVRKGICDQGMPWSHLCVKSPRNRHVLKRNYRNQNKLRDIEEDAHVNSF